MPSLPRALLQARVLNEVQEARKKTHHIILMDDPEVRSFPATLNVTLRGAPGPIRKNGQVVQTTTHRLRIQLTQDYPYQKPIVQWMSEIFHPNIMTYSEGGFVCTRFLEQWSWTSTLSDFLRALEGLLLAPKPKVPYATCICREASAYFLALEKDATPSPPRGS